MNDLIFLLFDICEYAQKRERRLFRHFDVCVLISMRQCLFLLTKIECVHSTMTIHSFSFKVETFHKRNTNIVCLARKAILFFCLIIIFDVFKS